jgi:hypothetical protein
MNIKKKIEDNPIISLFILSAFLVSAAIGILQFFHNKEINLLKREKDIEIIDLKSKLSSIKRGIGSNEYLDIRKLFVKNEEIKSIPTDLSFFPEEQFYAQKDFVNLKYNKYSIVDLYELQNEEKASDLFKNSYTNLYVHFWTTKEEIRIEGADGLNFISPSIALAKRSKEELRDLFGILFHKANIGKRLSDYIAKNAPFDVDFDSTKIESNLRNMYDGNWSAILLDQYLTKKLSLPILNNNFSYKLLAVNKVGNLIYVQGLTTITKCKINKVEYKKYYLRDELIILSNAKEVYLISTMVPSTDPSTRSPYFDDITNWLGNFKMIIP